jgi:hypothetical protein
MLAANIFCKMCVWLGDIRRGWGYWASVAAAEHVVKQGIGTEMMKAGRHQETKQGLGCE